jgi:single-strand DNA-binding protein
MQLLIGRLTENASVKTLPDDRQVVNFSIAMNHSFTPKGGEKRKVTTYAQCSYWMGTGIAAYLTKGTLVEVAGFISVDAYTSLQGDAKGVLKFHCNAIQLHGGGDKAKQIPQEDTPETENKTITPASPKGKKTKKTAQNAAEVTEPIDDLPF